MNTVATEQHDSSAPVLEVQFNLRRRFFNRLLVIPIGVVEITCIYTDCMQLGAKLVSSKDHRLDLTHRCDKCGQPMSDTNTVNMLRQKHHEFRAENLHLRQAS